MESFITISLCMIVKNEEDTIVRCLDSVKDLVDEIIIVDTGSTDKTKSLVSKYTTKIYDFQWIDDFAAARNFASSKASMDYIFILDADDFLSEEDKLKFKKLKNSIDLSIDAMTMNCILAKDCDGNTTYSIRSIRLLKRIKNFQWIGAVHEYPQIQGKIIDSDVSITHSKIHHSPDRNLLIYENRLKKGETFSPRDLYYYANELFDHRIFEKAAEYYKKFLDIENTWVEDRIGACGKLADCYYNLGDMDQMDKYIYKSFDFDLPRAEFCCRLGYKYLAKNMLNQAVFWYKLATQLEKPNTWGLINNDCWTWLPHLQLCLCYDRLGNHKLAYDHNEIARTFKPNDERILYNKRYFESLGLKQ